MPRFRIEIELAEDLPGLDAAMNLVDCLALNVESAIIYGPDNRTIVSREELGTWEDPDGKPVVQSADSIGEVLGRVYHEEEEP